jgi:hypothetical protein
VVVGLGVSGPSKSSAGFLEPFKFFGDGMFFRHSSFASTYLRQIVPAVS